jgi:hypothetical protein
VVTNSFIASGSDGYDMLKTSAIPRHDTGFVDAAAFATYVTHEQQLAQLESVTTLQN